MVAFSRPDQGGDSDARAVQIVNVVNNSDGTKVETHMRREAGGAQVTDVIISTQSAASPTASSTPRWAQRFGALRTVRRR